MPGSWAGSTRRKRLPGNWSSLRARMLARDNYQCRMIEHGARCEQIATDVDHIAPSGSDAPSNLVSLCATHHGRKTAAEGNKARSRQRREAEPHPGLLSE